MKVTTNIPKTLWRALVIAVALLISVNHWGQCAQIQMQADTYLYTQENFAQSFRSCGHGNLDSLQFYGQNFLQGDITATLTLVEGEGYTGDTLYTADITLSDVWGALHRHAVSEEVNLVQDSAYTFILEYYGDYGLMWGAFSEVYEDGCLYRGGQALEGVDMGFATFVSEAPVTCLTWKGNASNDWHLAANWEPQQVPGPADCVSINDEAVVFPVISQVAYAGELALGSGANLAVRAEGSLEIFKHFDHQGEAELKGKVVTRHVDYIPEISGSPSFSELMVDGLFYTTEALEIRNVLDLSQGYMVNPGTEVYVRVGEQDYGHVYMPQDAIVGEIIYRRQIEEFGYQIIGLPFVDATHQRVISDNSLEEVAVFEHINGFDDFDSNWIPSDGTSENKGVLDALCMEVSSEEILVVGQSSNEDVTVISDPEDESQGKYRLISNPYPSHIDWDKSQYSEGAPRAIYEWNTEVQQFASNVHKQSVHGADQRLAPTDAIFVRLGATDDIQLSYKTSVISPEDLSAVVTELPNAAHRLHLQVTTSSDMRDEQLIVFSELAAQDFDPGLDAYKIPSLNEMAPTFGSITPSGEVLTIDARPMATDGDIIPLYLHPGLEGDVVFSPLLIDLGAGSERVFLHDRKEDHFHDLLGFGNYQTKVFLADDRDRFVLHFGENERPSSGNRPLAEAPWTVVTVNDEISIRPNTDVELIPEHTMVTVHSLDGKLYVENAVVSDVAEIRLRAHVAPGYYIISIHSGEATYSDKFWLD